MKFGIPEQVLTPIYFLRDELPNLINLSST